MWQAHRICRSTHSYHPILQLSLPRALDGVWQSCSLSRLDSCLCSPRLSLRISLTPQWASYPPPSSTLPSTLPSFSPITVAAGKNTFYTWVTMWIHLGRMDDTPAGSHCLMSHCSSVCAGKAVGRLLSNPCSEWCYLSLKSGFAIYWRGDLGQDPSLCLSFLLYKFGVISTPLS